MSRHPEIFHLCKSHVLHRRFITFLVFTMYFALHLPALTLLECLSRLDNAKEGDNLNILAFGLFYSTFSISRLSLLHYLLIHLPTKLPIFHLFLTYSCTANSLYLTERLRTSMTQTPPFGGRSKLLVPLTQLTGSPGELSKSANSFSAFSVPGAKTNYSPFRFAGLQPPTTYVRSMQFAPRRAPKSRDYGTYTKLRLGHILSSRPLWFFLLFGALMMWWFHGGRDEMDLVRDGATKLSREFFSEERTRDLQFFPATNPKIHVSQVQRLASKKTPPTKGKQYVGRWTATPNRLRRDGTFAGG